MTEAPLATAEHFMRYFGENPLVDSQYVYVVLGSALIGQLVEQGGVEPSGYALLVHHIVADHSVGRDSTGKEVPQVVQDEMRALLYETDMRIWARKAVGDEFADKMRDFLRGAEGSMMSDRQ